MSSKRKKYSASEKAKITLDAIKDNMTMAEIVGKYSVHPTQVNKCKKQGLLKGKENVCFICRY